MRHAAWALAVLFVVDTTPPPTPSPVSPANAAKTSDTTPTFDWSSVTDPSGVTYQLRVDNHSDFTSPAVSVNGLAASVYTAGAALANGLYHWRVRAADGAGNLSAWSAARTFGPGSSGSTKFTYLNFFSIASADSNMMAIPISNLAKFDNFVMRRGFAYRYDGLDTTSTPTARPTLWQRIKDENPNARVWIYSVGVVSSAVSSDLPKILRNSIGRVDHLHSTDTSPAGTLDDTIPNLTGEDFHLRTSSGAKVYNPVWSGSTLDERNYYFRFGDPDFVEFWTRAIKNDIKDQPYSAGANGIHIDGSKGTRGSGGGFAPGSPSAPGYDTQAGWSSNMLFFYRTGRQKLATYGIETQAVSDDLDGPGGTLWNDLDNAAPSQRPHQLLSEFMFVIFINGKVIQRSGGEWVGHMNALSGIQNVEVVGHNAAGLGPSGTGVDLFGQSITHEEALHYALASFLMVKRESPRWYFGFERDDSDPGIPWYPEFDALNGGHLDLGAAVGTFQTFAYNGNTLYYREFERGYVLVNPNNTVLSGIPVAAQFGEPMRRIRRADLDDPLTTIPTVSTVSLNKARAAIFRKVD